MGSEIPQLVGLILMPITKPTTTEPIPILTDQPIPSHEPLPVLTDHPGGGPGIGASHAIPWAQIGIAALVVMGVLIVGFAVWKVRRARREATAARSEQIQRWREGVEALDAASDALMRLELECQDKPDPAGLVRPLLADVNEPATAQFYAAFCEAQTLRTDTIPTDDNRITAFVTAAHNALRAFEIASANAYRRDDPGQGDGTSEMAETSSEGAA